MKDITKQLELVSRITIDKHLRIPIRKGEKTFWVLFSREHLDMISNHWKIVDRDNQNVVTFPKASDVVTYLEKNGLTKQEIQDEIEYIVHSHINFTMGNLVEIKELFSDDEIHAIHEVEVARFNALKVKIEGYFNELVGESKEKPTVSNHLTVVKGEEND